MKLWHLIAVIGGLLIAMIGTARWQAHLELMTPELYRTDGHTEPFA